MLYRVEDGLIRALPKRNFPVPVAYLGSTVIVGIAFFIRWVSKEYWEGYPLLLFIPAIFLSALIFEHASGLYATALSAGLAAYFFIEPIGSFRVSAHNVVPFLSFIGIGCAIGFLTEVLRHALNRIAGDEQKKDLLLRELAHRTKNDFMTMTSILRLQAREQPEATRAVLDAAVERLAVMGQLHEQLLRRKEHAVVNARDYLEALCGNVSEIVRDARPVSIQVVADPVELTAETAAPVGLIVNELVTNALKHAFPEGRTGTVDVGFRIADPGTAEIEVRDNGVGCPSTVREGLGSQLVRLLARQMKGTVTREPANGGCRTIVRVQLRPA